MKVSIAKNLGFCFGVKRAIDKTMRTKGRVYTLGPLIHNPQVIKKLEENGKTVINSIDEVNNGTVIIRTHGVPDSMLKDAEKKNLKIIDLTCPFVKKAQDYAKKFHSKGYKVFIVGEKEHPEIKGILGNIENGIVIEKPEDVEKIGNYGKAGVVFQTTLSSDNSKKVVKKLKKKCNELEIAQTICSATSERQKSAKELAKKVDLMIVIGGRNSGNTKRLVQSCSSAVETKQVETGKELKKEWFNGKKHVGITAGASTPNCIINNVARRVRNEF